MKKLIALISILAILPLGVFAAVNSVKVSGDITATGISRNLSLGGDSSADASDVVASQLRLRIDAALTENVSAVVGLINERLWGNDTAVSSNSNVSGKIGRAHV